MFLDHALMIILVAAFMFPAIRSLIIFHGNDFEVDLFANNSIYYGVIGFAMYFCKDIIHGQSISKRFFKIVVVDNRTGYIATPLKCLLRNLTVLIWPVEVFVTLYSPQRRLGDKLAGTKIIQLVEAKNKRTALPVLGWVLSLVISYLFVLLYFFL